MKRKRWKKFGIYSLTTAMVVSGFSNTVTLMAAEKVPAVSAVSEKEGGILSGKRNEKEVSTELVNGHLSESPSSVNLTKQGDIDWVHMDSDQFGNFNQKLTAETGITDISLIGKCDYVTEGSATRFVYSDGMSPMVSEDNNTKALVFTGEGNGFSFRVPGSTEERNLNIYTGVWAADIEVQVSVNGEEAYSHVFGSEDTTGGSPARYQVLELGYHTLSEEDEVTVTVMVKHMYDATYGNMNIGGITLGTGMEEDDGSVIAGEVNAAPGSANLTMDGGLDWLYFNHADFASYNRKATEKHLISDVTLIGNAQSDPLSWKSKTVFGYSDGTSPESASGARNSYVLQGEGSGMEFTLPGSKEVKYVSLYAGAWAADVKIEVLVNDTVQYSTRFESPSTTPDNTNYQVARLQYQTAEESDVVKVRTTVSKVYDREWGNMNVSAVTVSDKAPVNLEETIKTDNWEIDYSGGELQSLKTKIGGEMYNIPIRTDQYSGFVWTIDGRKVELPVLEEQADGSYTYSGSYRENGQDLTFTMHYDVNEKGQMVVTASMKNNKGETVEIDQASIQLGFNTYLERYPDYNDQMFPTLLRCEKTHLWGYFSTPSGRLMAISTDSPVASYTLDYESGAHRIYSASLDVLQSGKLPQRHPQDMNQLGAKEEKVWNIYLQPVEDLNAIYDVKPVIAENTELPMLDADRYTLSKKEESQITIRSEVPIVNSKLEAEGPDGETFSLALTEESEGVYKAVFDAEDRAEGTYTITAENDAGYKGEMMLSIRNDWSWYMKKARQAAVEAPQKGSTHAETYYGFYSGYIAKKYFPDAKWDNQMDEKFEEVYPLMYDVNTGLPTSWEDRIQNHSTTLGISVDQYESSGNMNDLERAEGLADFLMTKQGESGGYYCGSTDYTSVIYPAKSIMELMYVEKDLMNDESLSEEERAYYKERYDLHMESVTKAMDWLVKLDGNFETEGQGTFEDGANSCSVAQLSEFALMFPEGSPQRQKYAEAAEKYLERHTSHQQSIIPDARMNGGTLRFWEAQYDVEMGITEDSPNMMNSPHGWSAWGIYGLFNLYELTGNAEYLERGMNAMGSCAQLMGYDGVLNWAFISDPQRNAKLFVKDEEQSEGEKIVGKHVDKTIGEEYVPMISYWWKAPKNTYVTGYTAMGGGQGSCCDNDVHEVFKAMGEVALTKAYVVEKEDGSFESYNAEASLQDGTLVITPEEDVVSNVSVQLQSEKKVAVNFYDGVKEETVEPGKPIWISTKENAVDIKNPDKDSSLTALEVTGGELDREFDKDTLEYTVDIGRKTGEVTIIPTTGSDKASVYINGNPIEKGAGYTVKLDSALMEEELRITVKSELQSSTTVYTVKVSSMGESKVLSTDGQTAAAGSEYADSGSEGPAANVLDGDTDTIWHTDYSGDIVPMEERWIEIALKEEQTVCGVRYLPRQWDENGKFTQYEIHVSADNGETYQKVAEGQWDTDTDWKTAAFDDVKATNVRIVPVTTWGDFGSAAEVRVIAAGEEAPSMEADKTALHMAVAMAEKLEKEQNETSCYTEETWAAVQSALDNARILLDNSEVTQEEIDASFLELMTAINLLESDVQKAGLGAAIEGAKAILADASALADYTPESVEAVRSALAEAEAVYADTEATQTAINQAAANLMTAVNNLLVTETDNRLDILIQKAEELLQKEDQYTSDSVQALKDALEAAKEAAAKKDATEQEINDAYNALAEAMASLVRVANKAELENALNKANEILTNAGKYTDSSLEGLQEAKDAAQGVYDNDNATQEEIEEALKALINEILEVRLLGDVNLDEAVDSADAQALLRYNAELDELSEEQLDAADVNRDDAADSSDAGRILQYAAEMIEEF